jgi:hypothetical protein
MRVALTAAHLLAPVPQVLKHAQSGRTRWDMDMRLLAECTQGFALLQHQSQQVG